MVLALIKQVQAIAAVAAGSWDPATLRREPANVFCNAAGQLEICRGTDGAHTESNKKFRTVYVTFYLILNFLYKYNTI
jgi:hypothetical protein